jgi:uncharacterized protein (TIGR02217 family)
MINIVINDVIGQAAFKGWDEAHPLRKELTWLTDVVRYDNAKEQRNQILEQPVRRWYPNWELLDKAGRDVLIALFQRARGRYETFYYQDREDYACALTECIVTAAGGETTTQLVKRYLIGLSEYWEEDKKNIVPSGTFAPVVKIDGSTKTEGTHFTLNDATGIINWTAGTSANGALTTGQVVTAQYEFYYLVRFDSDIHADISPYPDLWQAQEVQLLEVSE